MHTATSAAKWLPQDFVESSQTGGMFTLVSYMVMLVVFACELGSFLSVSHTTMAMIDSRADDALQVNFDIDMYDIECRNLQVVVNSQGNDEPISALSQDFWLRPVDPNGRTYGIAMRPKQESEAQEHDKTVKKLEKEDGKDELDADWSSSHDGFKHNSFEHVIQAHDFTMINFFAGWCSHCQRFSPLWGMIADKVNGNESRAAMKFADRDKEMRSVRLIKMNCVDFKEICMAQRIDAYPSLRLYKADGSFSVFEGKRDEVEIIRWIERTVKLKSYGWSTEAESFERGCNAKGRLEIPRVPGYIELVAGGGDQNLNTRMTNVSHFVRHLSFTDPDDGKFHRKSWAGMPQDVVNHLTPMDSKAYVTDAYHEAWIHDLKVVSTVSTRGTTAYQFSHMHRLSRLPEDKIPQAQFHFDIEPFSVVVQREDKKWYDFVTSVLAILGGTFVVMRLFSNFALVTLSELRSIFPQSSRRAGHINIGHLD